MPLPFHLVTLTHATWDRALACARSLGPDALPELRLDLFPETDPRDLVRALGGHCLVTCRRRSEGGRWPDEDETGRLARLLGAVEVRPAWVDLEWDLPVPPALQAARPEVGLLRSVHVAPGVFDLDQRLAALPEGDAFKWVGWAGRLGDSGRLRPALAWARAHGIPVSAFLMGPKGLVSRALQAAWGGAFTYAAPDDGPPAAPGQLPLATLRAWRCAGLPAGCGLCGVIGDPVLHSRGPAFHNPRFQQAGRNLLYVPLLCGEADEAAEALEVLDILGLSITAPLKLSLPQALGLAGPLNTLWRQAPGSPWQGANTDAEALGQSLSHLEPGPVLLLGGGGVGRTSREVLAALGRPVLHVSRQAPASPASVAAFAPVGVVQATSLGMTPEDPLPFPELLEAALPGARWAVEWIYKEDTAFTLWARTAGLRLVGGATLFEAQAEAQSRRFLEGCG
jgi:3-dehydroquinate dehydratase/shikimate dehydrogenase